MKTVLRIGIFLVALCFLGLPEKARCQDPGFSMATLKSYPFPSGLTASGNRIAWVFEEEGKRNIYVAEAPDYEARQLTPYDTDDGQELTSVSISPDGQWVVYLRGGEHGSNWNDEVTVNPLSLPHPPKVQIWSVPFKGGDPVLIGEGTSPIIGPGNSQVTFVRSQQIWTAPIGGGEAEKLLHLRGSNGSPQWSPDGEKLAFVSRRGDHSFIGVYSGPDQRIQWISPDFDRDDQPRWSTDGQQLVFVRRPGSGGAPDYYLQASHNPWRLMVADISTGKVQQLWKAPETLWGSVPRTHGGINLHWGAERIVFLSYHDGWPHLYSLPPTGGEPTLLTPGTFMCEYISMSADGRWMTFSGNTGPDPYDIDRRHIGKVPVAGGEMTMLTTGTGNEWMPVFVNDDRDVALVSATPRRPPLPAVVPADGGTLRVIAETQMPPDFPLVKMVAPTQVVFRAPDGLPIHGTLFEPSGGAEQKPAVVYIHGGPPRQMLLGWHYSSYYSNAYAVNQYLANLGFVVLSVNYRLGIGYGYDFHYPPNTGVRGAAEYQDIRAAGKFLASLPSVDPDRIGVYGGSYGGYLTAFALAQDSELFAAGVDIHGVHDRSEGRVENLLRPDRHERPPDADLAAETFWKSSPVAYLDGWTSPVLVIHGDDDRNVPFGQSTDLVQRLRAKGVDLETLVIVDDTHHFMLHENQVNVNEATVDFLVRKLKMGSGVGN